MTEEKNFRRCLAGPNLTLEAEPDMLESKERGSCPEHNTHQPHRGCIQ